MKKSKKEFEYKCTSSCCCS